MAAAKNPRLEARLKRKRRISQRVRGGPDRPRLNVFRTSRHMYAQVIDDVNGRTIVAVSTLSAEIREQEKAKGKIEYAKRVGKLVAEKALARGISKVVFDRNGFLYHGRIEALAAAAREAGLQF